MPENIAVGKETHARTLVKTVTYRVVVVISDFAVAYLLTHQVAAATGFVVLSNLSTTVEYYLHERVWDKILWGLRPAKPSSSS